MAEAADLKNTDAPTSAKGSQFVGKWKHDRSENLEEFFKELGLNWAVRKMAVLGNPSCEFSLKDEQITYTVETAMWTDVMTFTVGEEFERVHNKVNLKCKFEWDGDKLVMTQAPVDPEHPMKAQRIVREIVDGELKQTIYMGDVVTVRYYKRV